MLQILLKYKADVNLVGGHYGTVLQAVSFEGHLEVMQILLDHNADVNLVGGHYSTALQAASSGGHLEAPPHAG